MQVLLLKISVILERLLYLKHNYIGTRSRKNSIDTSIKPRKSIIKEERDSIIDLSDTSIISTALKLPIPLRKNNRQGKRFSMTYRLKSAKKSLFKANLHKPTIKSIYSLMDHVGSIVRINWQYFNLIIMHQLLKSIKHKFAYELTKEFNGNYILKNSRGKIRRNYKIRINIYLMMFHEYILSKNYVKVNLRLCAEKYKLESFLDSMVNNSSPISNRKLSILHAEDITNKWYTKSNIIPKEWKIGFKETLKFLPSYKISKRKYIIRLPMTFQRNQSLNMSNLSSSFGSNSISLSPETSLSFDMKERVKEIIINKNNKDTYLSYLKNIRNIRTLYKSMFKSKIKYKIGNTSEIKAQLLSLRKVKYNHPILHKEFSDLSNLKEVYEKCKNLTINMNKVLKVSFMRPNMNIEPLQLKDLYNKINSSLRQRFLEHWDKYKEFTESIEYNQDNYILFIKNHSIEHMLYEGSHSLFCVTSVQHIIDNERVSYSSLFDTSIKQLSDEILESIEGNKIVVYDESLDISKKISIINTKYKNNNEKNDNPLLSKYFTLDHFHINNNYSKTKDILQRLNEMKDPSKEEYPIIKIEPVKSDESNSLIEDESETNSKFDGSLYNPDFTEDRKSVV